MAKKKTTQQQGKISPEKYIREKARTLPIDKCYVNQDWQKAGMANVVVTRQRPNGEFIFASFLVDTFCLGVKDVYYSMTYTADDIKNVLDRYGDTCEIDEISYDEAHNIIWGAVSFAEEAGIKPAKTFSIGQYILEDDTEEIPLIDYEFGKDGKYLLVVGEDGKEKVYLKTLAQRLGERFDFISPLEAFDDDNDEYEDEKYSYQHPEYPSTLSVRHQFIADALADESNFYRLSRETIDRILGLPAEEVTEDLHNIVMYTIGRTYRAIDDGTIEEDPDGSIMHSLLLLNAIKSPTGIDSVLEIMRQNGDFADFHLGDLAPEMIPPALYACSTGNMDKIIEYLYTPGYDTYMRVNALEVLAMTAINEPERRDEIIGVLRRLLVSLPERLPAKNACDATFAGFVMSTLADLKAKELIPEIKDVFATGLVDDDVAGECNDIIHDIENNSICHKYDIPTIDQQYDRIENFGK